MAINKIFEGKQEAKLLKALNKLFEKQEEYTSEEEAGKKEEINLMDPSQISMISAKSGRFKEVLRKYVSEEAENPKEPQDYTERKQKVLIPIDYLLDYLKIFNSYTNFVYIEIEDDKPIKLYDAYGDAAVYIAPRIESE